MKNLKRIKYDTMNSWNACTAPAYNLKVYNVINSDLQDKVFELMDIDGFYDDINFLIEGFAVTFDYKFQAGFNGRSGGYLVLYTGGKKLSEHKSICRSCGQRNFTTIEENSNICGRCGESDRINKEMFTIFTKPGVELDEKTTPKEVLKAFRKLAIDIVKCTEYNAKHFKIEEEEYTTVKTRKILVEN